MLDWSDGGRVNNTAHELMEHEAQRSFYLGRYNCVEYLGTGPLGDTFRAKIYGIADFEKPFALKRLRRSLCDDESFLERFVALSRQAANLDHPRLARIHEVNAQGSRFYVVSDFIVGLDLRRILDALAFRNEALSLDICLLIGLDIAEALHHLHSLAVPLCHYGISPATVMITLDGHVRIVDAGLCGALIRPDWTDDQTLVPRIGYFAPELLRNQSIDERSDIFALGTVLFELLSGNKAFPGGSVQEVLTRMDAVAPVVPVQNPELQTLLAQMLRSDSLNRTHSMADVRDVMHALLGDRAAQARSELADLLHRVTQNRPRTVSVGLPGSPRPATAAELLKHRPLTKTWIPPKSIRTKQEESPSGDSPLKKLPPTNTFAGLGPHDQVPVEWANVPGTPTEKATPVLDTTGMINSSLSNGSVRPPSMEQLRPRSSSYESVYGAAEILADTVRKPNPSDDEMTLRTATANVMDKEVLQDMTDATLQEPIPAPVFHGMDTGPRLSVPEPLEDLAETSPLHPMVQQPSSEILLPVPKRNLLWMGLGGGLVLATALGAVFWWREPATSHTGEVFLPASSSIMKTKPRTPTVPTAAEPSAATAGPASPIAPNSVAKNPPIARKLVEHFSIESEPSQATLHVDGKKLGSTPLSYALTPGKHELNLLLDGFRMHQETVTISDKTESTLRFSLAKVEVKFDRASLKVRCHSLGSLRILIDGHDTGRQCPNEERIWLAPGAHRLGLYSPETSHTVEKTISVRAGTSHSTRIYVKD